MYKRAQQAELLLRLSEPRRTIQVLSGPRQVGKSTVLKQIVKEIAVPYLLVSADDVSKDDQSWIGEVWSRARAEMKILGCDEYLLIIDEVHKISNWSEAIKKEWDSDTFNDVNIKVVLSGSSRLLLKDGLTESLAGRYELIRMPHWSLQEMSDAFNIDVDHYVYYGGYPGSATFIHNENRWKKYIKDSIIVPAIESDILMTKLIYKPQLIKQLFVLGCSYSGEEISFTKLLGQLQDAGNVTTLAGYLDVLRESHLLCGMQKYANDIARKYNSIPKMMVYNTALMSALSDFSFEKAYTSPKAWGRWVESAVGAHLLNMAEENNYKIYYWRERNDEVDFVVVSQRNCIAIEVKSGRRTTNKGLSVFSDKFKPIHSIVVGSGGVPLEKFLTWDISKLF